MGRCTIARACKVARPSRQYRCVPRQADTWPGALPAGADPGWGLAVYAALADARPRWPLPPMQGGVVIQDRTGRHCVQCAEGLQ